MQRIEASTLGFTLTKEVPASVDEFDSLAKKAGACLEAANLNVLYRSVFAEFRRKFAEHVEKSTGIARHTKTEGEGDKAKTVFSESEKVYLNRVVAESTGGDETKEEALYANWAPAAQSIMDSIVFDPSESERKGDGSRLVAKTYIKWAEQAFDNGKAGHLAGLLTSKLGSAVEVTGDREKDIATLSKAIAANEAKIRADRKTSEYGLDA